MKIRGETVNSEGWGFLDPERLVDEGIEFPVLDQSLTRLTCCAFLLSVVALRRFSAPSLIFSSLRISLRILSRCSSRSCCTLESEKSEFWSRPSCSRTDSPPGSLWVKEGEGEWDRRRRKWRTKGKEKLANVINNSEIFVMTLKGLNYMNIRLSHRLVMGRC